MSFLLRPCQGMQPSDELITGSSRLLKPADAAAVKLITADVKQINIVVMHKTGFFSSECD